MELEKEGERTENPQDQTQMEINPQKDKGSEKEQVMKRFLQEWKLLDERFISEDQKKLYKNMFQRYKEKTGEVIINQPKQLGSQGGQSTDVGTIGKRGRKRGRRPMSETIQMVGEMLINTGRVVPLVEVFQQLLKLLK